MTLRAAKARTERRTDVFSAVDLKQRDWTETAIKNFAGTPDESVRNPRYKTGPPMRLWSKRRIFRIEKTKRFLAWKEGSDTRRAAAEDGVYSRMLGMEERIQGAEITIERGYDEARLLNLACSTHGGNYEGVPKGEFVWSRQTARNCIRHNLTNYEALWRLINRGPTGKRAYQLLRKRVDDLIDEAYPEYRTDPK